MAKENIEKEVENAVENAKEEKVEKEVKNAVENAKEEKVEKTSDKVEKPVEYEEEFELFGYERERDEDGNSVVDNDSVIYDVPYRMGRYPGVKRPDGKQYDSYAVGFFLLINGEKKPRKFYCVPPQATPEMYETARDIFGANERMPIQIVRNTTTRTVKNKTKTSVTYLLRVSGKQDDGSVMSLNFKPREAGDRANFENMLSSLRHKGLIE